jgi:hypothetical protein
VIFLHFSISYGVHPFEVGLGLPRAKGCFIKGDQAILCGNLHHLAQKGFFRHGPIFQIFTASNPISTTWLRDTLSTCDGFSAIRHFPLLLKIGNGNVAIQGFIKQYFPVLFQTDDGITVILYKGSPLHGC